MSVKIWLFLLLLAPLSTINAQMGMGGGGMGGGGMGPASSNDSRSYVNICRISGRIIDSTGAPVKEVTIILQQQDNEPNPMAQPDDKAEDPYFKEQTTKKNGKFTFSSLPFYHEYKLTIMAEGYKRWEQDIRFIPKKNEKHVPFEQQKQDTTKPYQPPVKTKPSTEKDLGDIKLVPLTA